MKQFIRRVWLFSNLLYVEQKRCTIIQYSLTALLFILISALWSFAARTFVCILPSVQHIALLQNAYFFFVAVFMAVAISKSFMQFHSKKTVVRMFAIPATTAEKYLSVLLFTLCAHIGIIAVSLPIACSIMFFIGRLITMGANIELMGWNSYSAWFHSIFWTDYPKYLWTLLIVFGYFFAGGIFFKRGQFFKTVISLGFAGVFVTAVFVSIKTIAIMKKLHQNGGSILFEGEGTIPSAALAISSALAVLLGYFRFARMQCTA